MAGESNWTRGNFKKTSNSVSFGVRSTGSLFHSQPAVRHFNDGGLSDGEWARGENYGDGTTGEERVAMARDPNYKVPAPATTDRDDEGREKGMFEKEPSENFTPVKETKKQSFGEAFRSAKDGSTFEWNGKMYKKEYASPAKKELRDSSGKTFAEDVAERRAAQSKGSSTAATRSSAPASRSDENYSNEGRYKTSVNPVGSTSKASTGRGVIDTSDLDPNTLLPRRKS